MSAAFLAGRFAAKRPWPSAWGRLSSGARWEILASEDGKPEAALNGRAAEIAGGGRVLVTISQPGLRGGCGDTGSGLKGAGVVDENLQRWKRCGSWTAGRWTRRGALAGFDGERRTALRPRRLPAF